MNAVVRLCSVLCLCFADTMPKTFSMRIHIERYLSVFRNKKNAKTVCIVLRWQMPFSEQIILIIKP